MKEIARLSPAELTDLYNATAVVTDMPVAVVEKDFWVCYTLDHLFQRSDFREGIVFKGGTSLSKAFGLISRFSEDIDLILDWRMLGYGLDEPWAERSNTAQDKFKLESIERTNTYLAEEFAPKLKASLSEELGFEAKVYPSSAEETVIFEYSRIHDISATLDVIRLEVGPLAAWTPTVEATITPYIAEHGPQVFARRSASVTTVTPERSFWEKISILHQEANRPGSKRMPPRYSRHYYDVYRLGNSMVKASALANPGLLDKVMLFKMKFYRSPWACFEDAKPGTLRLVPPEYRMPDLAADYQAMQDMLMGDRPTLDEIMECLKQMEHEINSL
jgi:hypothetical protein